VVAAGQADGVSPAVEGLDQGGAGTAVGVQDDVLGVGEGGDDVFGDGRGHQVRVGGGVRVVAALRELRREVEVAGHPH
jgi:hypothetical protein